MRDFSVFDNPEEGIQVIDFNLNYVYLNKTLLSEIKLSPEQIIGRSMTQMFAGIDKTDIYREIQQCLQRRSTREVLNEFKFPDGRQTFYEIKIQPIQEGVILFTRDITKTKKGEILLQETNKQLEHFTHIAAHDLREPVRRLEILCEELLLDYGSNLPAEAKSICEQISNQSKNIMQLISDFRALSGIGSLKDFKKENVNIIELAKNTVQSMLEKFDTKNFEITFPEESKIIMAYPTLANILIRNLIENALSHGTDFIKLAVHQKQDQITFELSNKTKANPSNHDIFLPFVKGELSTSTGLGLAICKKIIDHHNGKIWSEHQNNIFKIYFSL